MRKVVIQVKTSAIALREEWNYMWHCDSFITIAGRAVFLIMAAYCILIAITYSNLLNYAQQ